MKRQKILILDIDDTILDWSHAFNTYIRKNGYQGEDIHTSSKRFHELLGDDYTNIIRGFNTSEDFNNIDYFRGSQILNEIDLFDKIICISSCGQDKVTFTNRQKNLSDKFPNKIDELITLPLFSPKLELMKELKNKFNDDEIFMLDDDIVNIIACKEIGINGVCIETLFHDSSNVESVYNLEEFIKNQKDENEKNNDTL